MDYENADKRRFKFDGEAISSAFTFEGLRFAFPKMARLEWAETAKIGDRNGDLVCDDYSAYKLT